MKKREEHQIRCVNCGEPRTVTAQNFRQVKRCILCQYKEKRRYNSLFIKRQRLTNKK